MNALIGAAHERALANALQELDNHFDRWRRGEIDPFELAAIIHKFHDGPARDIYNRFSDRRNSRLVALTAYSVASGLVEEGAVPPEVRPYIELALRFHREDAAEAQADLNITERASPNPRYSAPHSPRG